MRIYFPEFSSNLIITLAVMFLNRNKAGIGKPISAL